MAIVRANTDQNGAQASGGSSQIALLSADGTKVLFGSQANNLVPNDTNASNYDLFVKNLADGSIVRVNTSADGAQSNGGVVGNIGFSADGNKVVFASSGTTLVPGGANTFRIYVKNISTGEISIVNTFTGGTPQTNGASGFSPAISGDGTKVAFTSTGTNHVGGDTNDLSDVFVKDLASGVIVRANVTADGTQANAGTTTGLSLSQDGSRVAFLSTATNLATNDSNNSADLFVKDFNTGNLIRVNTALDGTQANAAASGSFALTPDGSKIVFYSTASNLVAGDNNNSGDIFIKDITTGAITRINTTSSNEETGGASSGAIAVSADGTKVAFQSSAANLVAGDTNSRVDTFVKDLITGVVVRVSVSSSGEQANNSSDPIIGLSSDGSKVSFSSSATNLVSNDTNDRQDIFVADTTCFVSGSSIRTARGCIAVEDLRVGDCAITASGEVRPIRWIGYRTLACDGRKDVMPVRIAAHAFGENRPACDLFVSPAHAIAVDVLGEVLIPAIRLVNGTTIAQVPVAEVTYWHVELDSHDLLLAEGLPAESYLDCGNRRFFTNAEATDLLAAPDARPKGLLPFCRPFHEDGPLVEIVRARLGERAETLGWYKREDIFAGLHLVADGRTIRPEVAGLTARFVVPADARDVQLVSASSVPAHVVPGSSDDRRLGVALAALSIDDGLTGARAIALDDALLDEGFHLFDGGARWTDGSAVLPAALWDGCKGSFFLRVELAGPALPRWIAPGETAGVVSLADRRQA